jgi:hypothetical protein
MYVFIINYYMFGFFIIMVIFCTSIIPSLSFRLKHYPGKPCMSFQGKLLYTIL